MSHWSDSFEEGTPDWMREEWFVRPATPLRGRKRASDFTNDEPWIPRLWIRPGYEDEKNSIDQRRTAIVKSL
jgi:hypothetical protein